MAAMSEEQLLCPICLEVFTEPVSTPCGHNFCKSCISKHWEQTDLCQCPMCKEKFSYRPLLKVNILFSELVGQFRNRPPHEEDSVSSERPAAAARDVSCDVCTEPKLKALKSCLVCLLSYCQSHLEPHGTVARLKRHQLTKPVENLEDRMCLKHDKALELFCRSDQACVCMLCTVLDHKGHHIVPLREEYEEQQKVLRRTLAQTQWTIEKRRRKIQEIRLSLQLSQKSAHTEMDQGVQVYTALMDTVQRSLDQFKEELQEKQRRVEKQAEDWITELELEISELQRRSTEGEQLTRSEDNFYFLQRFNKLKTAAHLKDWTQVSLEPPSFEGSVDRAVAQLQITLSGEIKTVQLKRLQQWAVDVTLDTDTANPCLVLSDDLKQVHDSGVRKELPENPKRFTDFLGLLGKQSFSSGRSYFEVQVKGNPQWDLGVARESVNRKKGISLTPQNGYWTIVLRDGDKYRACADRVVNLNLKSVPGVISVFVDYEQGLVSFYDADTAALIYSFTGCTFTEKLYPYFSPCWNDKGKHCAPLIIK